MRGSCSGVKWLCALWEHGKALRIVQSGSDPLEQRGLSNPDRTLGGRYQAEVSLCQSQWSPRYRIRSQETSLLNSKITGDSILGFLSIQTISQTPPSRWDSPWFI